MRHTNVIIKYALIHLVELALLALVLVVIRLFVDIPVWLIITVIVLSIVKDIVLFPKVWRAYASGDRGPMRELIGLEAAVIDPLDPVGFVRVRGELWKAEVGDQAHPAAKGDRARVVGIKGMTLIVEKID